MKGTDSRTPALRVTFTKRQGAATKNIRGLVLGAIACVTRNCRRCHWPQEFRSAESLSRTHTKGQFLQNLEHNGTIIRRGGHLTRPAPCWPALSAAAPAHNDTSCEPAGPQGLGLLPGKPVAEIARTASFRPLCRDPCGGWEAGREGATRQPQLTHVLRS